MGAILITLNVSVLTALALLGWQWPPAFFAVLVVGPLSILSLWSISAGDISARTVFVTTAAVSIGGIATLGYFWPAALYGLFLIAPIVTLGVADMLQTKRAIRRNFPVIGHIRYFLEEIRPEIQQYFVERDHEGTPFDREERSIIYQRSKGALDTLPFGTQLDVYEPGYEWINHSMLPVHPKEIEPRVVVGAGRCEQPYAASIFNISAMSFGSLSSNACL